MLKLKQDVLAANLELQKRGLVIYTWGNVSGIDRERGLVVIKPSGVPYEKLGIENLVVVDLAGNVVEGNMRPSSDTSTHLVLYKNFSEIGGIVHTHSTHATMWAQAGRHLPCLGTTHADYFYGSVPCTRELTADEVNRDYETETGNVIVETFQGLDPGHIPGVLVAGHGPFTWGKDPDEAVRNSVILEEIARIGLGTVTLTPANSGIPRYILDKHFLRKHGENAYYGQDGL